MKLSALDIDLLTAISKRGIAGITKEELIAEVGKTVKGIAYADLWRHVTALANGGMVDVEMSGPDDFTVYITDVGKEKFGK